MPHTNLSRLIEIAAEYGGTVHASTWRAEYVDECAHGANSAAYLEIYHYGTPMFAVVLGGEHDRQVVPISRGRGSQSDKCGVSKILQGARLDPCTYYGLYSESDAPSSPDDETRAPAYPRPWPHPETVARYDATVTH
jgi:hypothetical protein